MKIVLLFITVFFIVPNIVLSREFRVEQIPNGNKNQCLNCHFSMDGGALNPFGEEVFSNHLSVQNLFGNVVWSKTLAELDSDGDGYSNGIELQDAEGAWKIGQANPGDFQSVTLPGNPTSHPVSVDGSLSYNPISGFSLTSIAPNPARDNFQLNFVLHNDDYLSIKLFDLTGNMISLLEEEFYGAGTYIRDFRLSDESKGRLPKGTYFLFLATSNYFDVQKIIVSD
ncbi:MAG: T9SS type A sorting domain-containing protein [Candidatus Kapabacteria bacterium]|jgi:hypothetical protein|nr:T9SS type A sorting domain-containing protein [Candidatus Kapabacteria bacterium]